jgi:uncharacterized phage protein gp47/JayE
VFTVEQIVQNIVNQLRLLDPAVSAEVGTPERKIIEATAEMIASSQVDFTVLNQQHDLDAMTGGRLDAYLSVFNFGRQSAVPSYGTVTFGRNTAATDAIIIPLGTQVQAFIDDPFFPTLTYVTVQTVVLEAGQLSVKAPVQCAVAGTVGNIDAGQIVGFGGLRTINGITTVTNEAPLQGGLDAEDDATYKTRFQNTFLRNISGTTDMFLALAVSMSGVSKATVVGPVSRYQEYVQVPAARDAALKTQAGGYDITGTVWPHKRTSVKSTVPYSKYTWPNAFYLTDGTLDPATAVFFRQDVDFVFNAPPILATAAGTNEIQTLTRTATGGSVTLAFRGAVTGPITVGAALPTAAAVQTALRALATIGGTNVSVSGSNGGPFTVTFSGELGSADVPAIVVDNTLATGGTVVDTTPTPGVPAAQTNDTPATSPNVTFLNPSDPVDNLFGDPRVPDGGILFLEHAYMSVNSRNDIAFGILNCVDVFVDGGNIAAVSSVEAVPDTPHNIQNSDALQWTYQKLTATKVINFRRAIDSAPCAIGNRLQPLYWQPAVGLPDTLTVGVSTFYRANYFNPADSTYYNQKDPVTGAYTFKAHYALAIEVNSHHGSTRARNGIEWFLTGNNDLPGQDSGDPADGSAYSGDQIENLVGSPFTVDSYLYDQNISQLQAISEQSKQVTQDVLVHRAKLRYFRPMVTVMYTLGATRSTVDASIVAALDAFYGSQYFGSAVQLSDFLQTIHNVPGVDNVRWTNEAGNKLEEVGADGSTLDGGPYYVTADFFLQDNELPASPGAGQITIVVRAQNTWGT